LYTTVGKKLSLQKININKMKKVIYTVVAFALLLQSCGEAKEETTEVSTETHAADSTVVEEKVMVDGYEYYGIKEMDTQGGVSVEEMKAIIDSTGAFEGKINTTLFGVCKKAGCWVTIDNPGGEPIRVVFGEHAFFVPVDTQEGREVIIEGMAVMDTTSVDMQKHFLDDAKEAGQEVPQSAYDEITEPLVEISFNATGILIK
jgi:hypothetical protein